MLEAASRRTVLMPSRVLEAGPPGSKMVAASRAAAAVGGGSRGRSPEPEAKALFPAFRLPGDWDVVVQESGGILLAEAAMRAFREGAEDRIVRAEARIRPEAAGIRITTPHDEVLVVSAIRPARIIPEPRNYSLAGDCHGYPSCDRG